MLRSISTLYIDSQVAGLPETERIRESLDVPAVTVDDQSVVFQAVRAAQDCVGQGKRSLFLTNNRGGFLKNCPGTSYYRCCGYKILDVAGFCTMDCSYCILQAYFHPPVLKYYINRERLAAELDAVFHNTGRPLRIGTGEFTDSMIWNCCTDLNSYLVELFAAQTRAVLELKTKTADINVLRGMKHNRKTIAAWSLNTERVISSEERRTATLDERLAAAAECEAMGYPVAFHFDPVILYDGCKEEYLKVIDRLFSYVSHDNIVWISIGAFRFMPQLKPVIEKRFPESVIAYGEFVPGMDRKMRYFKPLRIDIYRSMVERIREHAPGVCVYFCMEDDQVWEQSIGFVPAEKGGLPHILDESAVTHCGLAARF